MTTAAADELVRIARDLTPTLASLRDQGERERRLPTEAAHAMADAGLFRLWVPSALGGHGADIASLVRVVEQVSSVDAAAGWCLAVAATYGRYGGYLREDVAREIFTPSRACVAGVINPTGKASPTKGGWHVTGRWSFGSGIHHSSWVLGNCVVGENDVRTVFFPRTECELIDNWHVGGLRGTGSVDFAVKDLFVPEERVIPAFNPVASQPGTLYALPVITVFIVSIASVPLGIARGAIDALAKLATEKTPTGSRTLLRDRATVQADVGRAEALVRSARAYLLDASGEMWRAVASGREASMALRADVRLACAQTARNCVQAVDLIYDAGGATSIREACPLERALRDVHAAAQHIAVSANNFELAGRVLLGLDPGTPRF